MEFLVLASQLGPDMVQECWMTRASGISREEEGQWSGGGEEGSGRLSCILAMIKELFGL